MKATVKAIRKHKEEFIIIAELTSGQLVLFDEYKLPYQAKVGREYEGIYKHDEPFKALKEL